jgi:hypothetical protein
MAQPKGLMRSLGEFVGHIARAVKTDPEAGDRREVRREVEERPGEVDGRKVTLRRTIIEEVRFEDERPGANGGSAGGGGRQAE